MVFIKHQSVCLLVEAFGKHGCDPPMGNGFLKREVGLDYDHTEVFVHKYPWLGGEETSSFESACDCLRENLRGGPVWTCIGDLDGARRPAAIRCYK